MVSPLIISACNSQPSETKALPLTEDQLEKRLAEIKETGFLNIESIEEASQIALYKIAVPVFIQAVSLDPFKHADRRSECIVLT